MTDPIADMLTRLRNANQAYHDQVSCRTASSAGLAEILKQRGHHLLDVATTKNGRQDAGDPAEVRPQP